MVSREDCPGVGRTLNIRMSVLLRDGKGENREAQGGLEGGNWNFATQELLELETGLGEGGEPSGASGWGTAPSALRLQISASHTWKDTLLVLEATSVVICSGSPRNPTRHLNHKSPSFFCQGTDNKYVRLCHLYKCLQQIYDYMGMTTSQLNLIFKNTAAGHIRPMGRSLLTA